MMHVPIRAWLIVAIGFLAVGMAGAAEPELLRDPSFERTKDRDQWGLVFSEWQGWKYEGDCEFRVGNIARTGKSSCLLIGQSEPKIRIFAVHPRLEPGRYRITAYLRGLDIGTGRWEQDTEFAFDGQYFPLRRRGTFGWTKLTYVGEVTERKEVNGPSFGLMSTGYLWIDDVAMELVGLDVPVTPQPVWGDEESPFPVADLGSDASIVCPECGYRNRRGDANCYACGTPLDAQPVRDNRPPIRLLTSFEKESPFTGGDLVTEHASEGAQAWQVRQGYTDWHGPLDWSGYDYLKVDVFADSQQPLELQIEIHDGLTRDYWTRVNRGTVVPPGRSTLTIPLNQLYVGEKSRPGRKLLLHNISRFVFSIGEQPAGTLTVDNLRLERDTTTAARLFPGLQAFDLGSSSSPLMPGFQRLTPANRYSKGRGYGLLDATIWRVYDVLQPDPLYQDFICIERGGIALDVPSGKYHVFVNLDNPSGYWGEYQRYRFRSVRAEGREVVRDMESFQSLQAKYLRHWDHDDLPQHNTFTRYQQPYFAEKEFDVEVRDGQLNLDFDGSDWACSVSCLIVYPLEEKERGAEFVQYVRGQRQFFFDNQFQKTTHVATGDPLDPTPSQQDRGYVLFTRDYMKDVYDNDRPRSHEIDQPLKAQAFCGEYEPLTLAVMPLRPLGNTKLTISDLRGPQDAVLPASRFRVGYVSYRNTRVTMEGSVYTSQPRWILPKSTVDMPLGTTRRFWLTAHVPADAQPGLYRGTVTVTPQHGKPAQVPVEFHVHRGTLDEADIPIGPWGHAISIPWYDDDPRTQIWREEMTYKSLRQLRDYGFTSFSGMPEVHYLGFANGQPRLDFTRADAQMRLARKMGFHMPIVNYCPFIGLNLYERDMQAMREAGFEDYSAFVRAVFSAVQTHAEAQDWLPVYWNLADEPLGESLLQATENARAFRQAFPDGPPYFTAATSLVSGDDHDRHLALATAVHTVNVNGHDPTALRELRQAGGKWAFYNDGNRWTYGTYLFKAAREYDVQFRLSWHWNNVAGDPYYALDCREDDYAWCNVSPSGELVPSLHFEREMREGLDDYRYLLTLDRLARERQSDEAAAFVRQRMEAFTLGQRNHDQIFPATDWHTFREQAATLIDRLRE